MGEERKIRTRVFFRAALCILPVIMLTGCVAGPSAYFRSDPFYVDRRIKVAIIPFTNLSREKDADRKITSALVTHLLRSNYFDVIESGETRKAIKEAKARPKEDLSLEDIKAIGGFTRADVLFMGTVEAYKIDSNTVLGEKIFVPEVAVNARLVSSKDGSIIWSANHHKRGDDRVTVFGMGRIESISELTDIIIRDIISSLVNAIESRLDAVDFLMNGSELYEYEEEPYEDSAEYEEEEVTRIKQPMAEKPRQQSQAAIRQPAAQWPSTPVPAVQQASAQSPAAQNNNRPTQIEIPRTDREQIRDSYQAEYRRIKSRY